jgi:hypothetical protein
MRSALAISLLLLSSAAFAETVEIRPKHPVAEFTIPDDDWKVTHTARGVEAVSDDKEVYFWIEAYKPNEFDAVLAEHNAYWKEQGVAITSSDEQKHSEKGLEVSLVTKHATWNGEPTVLYYVEYHLGLKSQTNVVFTYWASPEGDKEQHDAVGKVLESLKVTEQ